MSEIDRFQRSRLSRDAAVPAAAMFPAAERLVGFESKLLIIEHSES